MALKHAKAMNMLRKSGPSHFDASDIGSGSGKKSNCFPLCASVRTLKSFSTFALDPGSANHHKWCYTLHVALENDTSCIEFRVLYHPIPSYTSYAWLPKSNWFLGSQAPWSTRLVEQAPVEALSLLLRARRDGRKMGGLRWAVSGGQQRSPIGG